jgi:Protein of unknown function DUF72
MVLEPCHPSWFTSTTNLLLNKFTITRAAVDPPKGHPLAAEAGGDAGLTYYRLHGTPHMYYSNYENDFLEALAYRIKPLNNVWVIFDNTALSYAYSNAIRLQTLVGHRRCLGLITDPWAPAPLYLRNARHLTWANSSSIINISYASAKDQKKQGRSVEIAIKRRWRQWGWIVARGIRPEAGQRRVRVPRGPGPRLRRRLTMSRHGDLHCG